MKERLGLFHHLHMSLTAPGRDASLLIALAPLLLGNKRLHPVEGHLIRRGSGPEQIRDGPILGNQKVGREPAHLPCVRVHHILDRARNRDPLPVLPDIRKDGVRQIEKAEDRSPLFSEVKQLVDESLLVAQCQGPSVQSRAGVFLYVVGSGTEDANVDDARRFQHVGLRAQPVDAVEAHGSRSEAEEGEEDALASEVLHAVFLAIRVVGFEVGSDVADLHQFSLPLQFFLLVRKAGHGDDCCYALVVVVCA